MSKDIKDLYRRALEKGASNIAVPKGRKGIHTKKFHRAVTKIARREGGAKSVINPYAVAMARLGRNKAVKKKHRRVAKPGK